MTDTNRLGPAIGKRQITTAALDLTRTWVSTYLADAERQHGITPGKLERPRDYERIVTLSKWPEVQLPAVFAMVPGLAAPPQKRGTGEYFAIWSLALIGVVHGADGDDADEAESVYGMALREMLLNQAGDLDGVTVMSVEQTDESYDDLPVRRSRSVRAASVEFALHVRYHASTGRALAEPLPDPIGDPGPYATAETVTVTLSKTPTDKEF